MPAYKKINNMHTKYQCKYFFNLISHISNCSNIKSDIKYNRKSKKKKQTADKNLMQAYTLSHTCLHKSKSL